MLAVNYISVISPMRFVIHIVFLVVRHAEHEASLFSSPGKDVVCRLQELANALVGLYTQSEPEERGSNHIWTECYLTLVGCM